MSSKEENISSNKEMVNNNENTASNIADYEKKLPEITAIKKEDIFDLLSIPIEIYIQEAEDLYKWCQIDKDQLIKKGLDWKIVDDIPMRAGALREAESRWLIQRFNKKETGILWKKRSVEAFKLRNDIIHEFRFAYRKNEYLLGRVNAIAGNQTYAGAIQNLNDLSVLGKNYPDELKFLKFDLTLLDTAAQLAKELGSLLATIRSESDYSSIKLIRDQAFTYLKIAVDEVCEIGQYIFWKNSERKKGYSSDYLRRIRNKRQRNSAITENTNDNTEKKD